ncbi:MAG: hypothetical protein AAF479_12960 [Pseudomonadota bacterium]
MDHSYYFGRSGSGKSSLMLHHAIDAITAERGLFFLDPHGPDTTKLLDYIPPRRRPDVIYFDPTHKPVSFNPLDRVTNPDQTAEALLYAFRDIWRFGKASTPVFDEYVLHGFLTLLQIPRSTVLHLRPLLTSESYRAEIVPKLTDPYLQSFWHEFEALTPKEKRDEIRSTKNKINSVIADSRLRAILGQGKSAFGMADVLKGKIFLARLPQGELGLQKTRLLGMLLLTQLHVAALSRKGTTPFEVFIDEVHNFQGTALMEMLSGIRKFGVALHLSHQYVRQLEPELRDAMTANTGRKYLFRTSKQDGDFFDEMDTLPKHSITLLHELPRFHYRSDNEVHAVLPLPKSPCRGTKSIVASDRTFSRPRATVDRELRQLMEEF